MTIQTIYDHYHIPPNLQLHMLQVAAVGQYLVDHWQGENIDKDLITRVLLLHDMGNIIKFKRPFLGELEKMADFWENVQEQFIEKYGNNVHVATLQIAKQIVGSDSETIQILKTLEFHTLEEQGYSSSTARICDHADMLVSPVGIVDFSDRIADLLLRYDLTGQEKGIILRQENAIFVQKRVDVDLKLIVQVDFSKEVGMLKNYLF